MIVITVFFRINIVLGVIVFHLIAGSCKSDDEVEPMEAVITEVEPVTSSEVVEDSEVSSEDGTGNTGDVSEGSEDDADTLEETDDEAMTETTEDTSDSQATENTDQAKYKGVGYLDDNGVTVKAGEIGEVGLTFVINEIEYKIVDKDMLRARIQNEESVSDVCTSFITDMSELFRIETDDDDINFFDEDISSWDTSNVTNMSKMFYDADFFNQDISFWDVSKVTNMSSMFFGSLSFNQDISNWDVSNVRDMRWMFDNASNFNQNISNWDVGNALDMGWMFSYADAFNQDISNWDVSKVSHCRGFSEHTSTEWKSDEKPNFTECSE